MNTEIDLQLIENGHQSIADLFRMIIQRGLANNVTALLQVADTPSIVPDSDSDTANLPAAKRRQEDEKTTKYHLIRKIGARGPALTSFTR